MSLLNPTLEDRVEVLEGRVREIIDLGIRPSQELEERQGVIEAGLRFQRIEAGPKQDQLNALSGLVVRMDDRLDSVEKKVDTVNDRTLETNRMLLELNSKVENWDRKLDRIEEAADRNGQEWRRCSRRLEGVESRLDSIEVILNSINGKLGNQ